MSDEELILQQLPTRPTSARCALRLVRMAAKLDQYRAAVLGSISPARLEGFERGEACLTIPEIVRYAQALKMALAEQNARLAKALGKKVKPKSVRRKRSPEATARSLAAARRARAAKRASAVAEDASPADGVSSPSPAGLENESGCSSAGAV